MIQIANNILFLLNLQLIDGGNKISDISLKINIFF
jgi:hypothetical protein